MPSKDPDYKKKYYAAHREELVRKSCDWAKNQSEEKKDEIRKRKREWARANYSKRREVDAARAKAYYEANKETVLAKKKAIRDADPNFSAKQYARREELNPGESSERQKQWKLDNPEKWRKRLERYKARRNELSKQRRSENPTRKLAENCRSRICHILKREQVTKSQSTFKFIGCTAEFFREFLEAQFTSGMTWENYGITWVVDHVMPLAGFDLTNPDHLRNAFHYSNCRPFGSIPNSIKSDSMPGPHQPLLV